MGRDRDLNLRAEIHINRDDSILGKVEGKANDLSRIFEEWNLPDLNKVKTWISDPKS